MEGQCEWVSGFGLAFELAVEKFLMPKIDIKGELRLKDFGTMKSATCGLEGLRVG